MAQGTIVRVIPDSSSIEFLTSGFFTVPPGVTELEVFGCGGGGGGGGAGSSSGATRSCSAGGAGGNGASIFSGVINVVPGDVLTISIPSGGGGGAPGGVGGAGSTGSKGGSATISGTGVLLTIEGGFGGGGGAQAQAEGSTINGGTPNATAQVIIGAFSTRGGAGGTKTVNNNTSAPGGIGQTNQFFGLSAVGGVAGAPNALNRAGGAAGTGGGAGGSCLGIGGNGGKGGDNNGTGNPPIIGEAAADNTGAGGGGGGGVRGTISYTTNEIGKAGGLGGSGYIRLSYVG